MKRDSIVLGFFSYSHIGFFLFVNAVLSQQIITLVVLKLNFLNYFILYKV